MCVHVELKNHVAIELYGYVYLYISIYLYIIYNSFKIKDPNLSIYVTIFFIFKINIVFKNELNKQKIINRMKIQN